ncbi:MAG TPA: hypothetical protein ENF49_03075 [Candidatus Altiarchaeales archaeon]|nr:hypothetical protein [Candidatus Altiarchaeales archaeon]HEX55092.1 hypothetical protein [Candidatus Altiarchaeales archaeon]
MDKFDLEMMERYPFLSITKEYVASLNLTLDALIEHPIYSSAVELGRERLINSINNKKFEFEAKDKLSCELSILSYVIARILANIKSDGAIITRFARNEARRSFEFLRSENHKIISNIMEDLNLRINNGRIHFTEYLRLTRNLTIKPEWKLVNRIMDSGYVVLNRNDEKILLREAIYLRIIEPIEIGKIPEKLRIIANSISCRRNEFDYIKIKNIVPEKFPPCILEILNSLESDEISHNARFVLATFLIGIGMKNEDIIAIFSRNPKFDERKTRYQIDFLSGKLGNTRYSCPGCEKIKSYGLCPGDCGANHPIKYLRDKYLIKDSK